MLLGDKFGDITLFDVENKEILDKYSAAGTEVNGIFRRRVISISCSTLEWYNTHLTFVAYILRGSPYLKILFFRHDQNLLKPLYTINIYPDFIIQNTNKLSTLNSPKSTKKSAGDSISAKEKKKPTNEL